MQRYGSLALQYDGGQGWYWYLLGGKSAVNFADPAWDIDDHISFNDKMSSLFCVF
jgi:hypothetical protein